MNNKLKIFLIGLSLVIGIIVLSDASSVSAYQSCGCSPSGGRPVNCVTESCPAGYSGSIERCDRYACCRECNLVPNPLGGNKTVCGACRCSKVGEDVTDNCVADAKRCNETCSNNSQCETGFCYGGRCRNSSCRNEADCVCPSLLPCNSICTSNSDCASGYCYGEGTRRCRNSKCKSETDCVCSTGDSVDGICGTTNNSCLRGGYQDRTDSATQYLWTCLGTGANGSPAYCALNKPNTGSPGVCGSTNNSCSSGTLDDIADSTTKYLWNCVGSGGTANCSLTKCIPSCTGKCTDPNKYTNQVCGNNGCGGNCYGSNVRPSAKLGDVYAGGVPIYAYDPQGGVSVYLTHDGRAMATLPGISGNYTYHFTPVAGTHNVCFVYVYDNPSGDRFAVNSCDTYTHYDPDDYQPSCTKRFELWNDGVLLATSSTNQFSYTDQVKRIMVDKGGVLNFQVRAYVDQKCWRFYTPPPDREPTEYHKYDSYTLTEVTNFDCSIPEEIQFYNSNQSIMEPEELTFDLRDDGSQPSESTKLAAIKCTHDDVISIIDNNVIVDEGELDACFDVLGPIVVPRYYKQYDFIARMLFNKCIGDVNFDINNFQYDGENWGPMNGSMHLEYYPNEERVSERFEYSGDVIVNPPPGFEQFYFPEF